MKLCRKNDKKYVILLLFIIIVFLYVIGNYIVIHDEIIRRENYIIHIEEQLLPGFFLKLYPSLSPGNGSYGSYNLTVITNTQERIGPFRIWTKNDFEWKETSVIIYNVFWGEEFYIDIL